MSRSSRLPHARTACVVAAAVAATLAAEAQAQSFAGTWTEVERTMDVTISSWGDDCPTPPQTSSTHPNTQLELAVEGDQIVFPRGRRSDRCWSDNAALRRTRFSKQGNRWTVECQTPADDARQEHGRYVVTADPTRIVIDINSEYDWTLRQDHCQATIAERRVLTRAAPPAADGGTPDTGATDAAAEVRDAAAFPRMDGGLLPLPDAQAAPRRCERPGAPARLRVRAVQTVQPGDRVPISVHQVDAQGCDLGPVAVTYELVGAARGCRIGSDGVFQACESVAQCDGETVRIRVTAGALSGMADIRISARIENGLGTVEPVWIDEPPAEGPDAAVGGSQVAASFQAQTPPVGPAAGVATPAGGATSGPAGALVARGTGGAEETEDSLALWLVVVGGGVIVLAVVIYLIAARRRGKKRTPAETIDDLAALRSSGAPGAASARPVSVAPPSSMPPFAPPPPAVPAAPPQGRVSTAPMHGPVVSVPVPSPGFVPAPLPPPPAMAPAVPAGPQWHCPGCRRESAAAGFCPEDGLALAAGPAPTGARMVIFLACPKCGRGSSSESKFCPVDRELLLPYGLGMNNFKAGLKGRPEPPERVCPKCGARAPGAARFCVKDGEQLVPSR